MTTLPVVKPGGPLYHLGVLSKKQTALMKAGKQKQENGAHFTQARQDLSTSVAVQTDNGCLEEDRAMDRKEK